ncbi:MAG: hypothetical protein AAB548_02500 [Patescibacteria group bacterium]
MKFLSPSLVLVAGGSLLLLFAVSSFAFDVDIKPSPKIQALKSLLFPTPTPVPTPSVESLADAVIPTSGYTVNIKWGDIGKKLVASGAIDLTKYKENYKDPQYQELLKYLTEDQDKGITITQQNSYFWINTLWALGLVQKSDVLDKGVMGTQYKKEVGNFASTGGWTLGTKPATKLYSSAQIIPLTSEQNQMVTKIAENIYRPCCGNSTAFPDCNHGMAMLALIELMVSQGYSETEVYQAGLAFNSYWFGQTYMDLAYYFKTKENLDWKNVDPKRALSAEFSSAQGYQAIKKQIEGVAPQKPSTGGGCGA